MKYIIFLFVFLLPIQLFAFTEEELLLEVNQVRTDNALLPVEESVLLNVVALAKAVDMCQYGYWAHNRDGNTWSFFQKYGYKYTYAGEVIGKGAVSASSLVAAWVNSPTHKAVLVNPVYTETGVGKACGITVQVFATSRL